jgi:hypothetical protein
MPVRRNQGQELIPASQIFQAAKQHTMPLAAQPIIATIVFMILL